MESAPNSPDSKPDIGRLLATPSFVETSVSLAVRDALIQHKKLGQSVVVWRDGSPVEVPAEQIPIDGDSEGPPRTSS
jgi:hypothetical protein